MDNATIKHLRAENTLIIPATGHSGADGAGIAWDKDSQKIQISDDFRGYRDFPLPDYSTSEEMMESIQDLEDKLMGDLKVPTQTLTVGKGKQFSTIKQAWDSLKGRTLHGWIDIKVDDGVYTATGINLDHQPYDRISITGNRANPAKCVLNFTKPTGWSTGVTINRAEVHMHGFTIRGNDSTSRCIYLDNHSNLYCASNTIRMENAFNGLVVGGLSKVYATGLKMTNIKHRAVNCGTGSMAQIHNIVIDGIDKDRLTKHSTNGKNYRPYGILAADGAKVWCATSDVKNLWQGFQSERNSYLWCDRSTATNCQYGYLAQWGGIIWGHGNTTVYNKAINCVEGFRSGYNGILLCHYAEAKDCVKGFRALHNGSLHGSKTRATKCAEGFHVQHLGYIEAGGSKQYNTSTVQYSSTSGTAHNTHAVISYS